MSKLPSGQARDPRPPYLEQEHTLMANQRIFTPFPSLLAGKLAKRLERSHLHDKGFLSTERVFSPSKVGNLYEVKNLLGMLTYAEDQLYINGHCNRGLDYLACDEN